MGFTRVDSCCLRECREDSQPDRINESQYVQKGWSVFRLYGAGSFVVSRLAPFSLSIRRDHRKSG